LATITAERSIKMMKIFGDRVNYNLETDKVIKSIDEPTFMTDRRREELRKTVDGFYYLHTDNDREDEMIITTAPEIDAWIEENDVEL
jgi:hypothetical protein